jgi:glutamate dehydrogenase/leucine dehydrogenase
MDPSLFTPLHKEGLTALKLRHDWHTGQTLLSAARLWEPDLDFSRYNHDFYVESLLTPRAVYYDDAQVRDLYRRYGLDIHLERVLDMLRQGRHFGIDCFYNSRFNIRFMGNLHNRTLGINNRSHAVLTGGIRRHSFSDPELEVIQDGLNLSRAMTYKNVAAEIPYGGCKTTVHMDPLDMSNLEVMGFLAYCLDSLRCFTGPDMGFLPEMADVMNAHFSVQFACGAKGPLGPSGGPTSFGVYLALKQAVLFREGSESLDGLTIAVQGLGAVGRPMCDYLLQENVKLIVADVDLQRALKLVADYPGRSIQTTSPQQIVTARADIFCPCAVGGIIHEGNILDLQFKIIFGGANNQLRAGSNAEEIRLAKLLAQRGILYQEAWWHNTGGVLAGTEEYEHGAKASKTCLEETIRRIVPLKTWQNLNRARELGVTPTECMYLTCEEKIYG